MLLLTAAAASFVPVPEQTGGDSDTTSQRAPGRDGPPAVLEQPEAVEVEFGPAGRPAAETVEPGVRVVVTVFASKPGQVEVEGLGRIDSVEAGAPAEFDLFTDREGRFDVVYEPVGGKARSLGTLIVEAMGPAGRRETEPGRDGARATTGSGRRPRTAARSSRSR